MIEFICEGCGVYVTFITAESIPKHGFCMTCAWLCEHVPDPEEFWKLYKEMERIGDRTSTK